MKSIIFINILLILLSQYECLNDCSGDGNSKKDCNTRSLSDGYYRCCYYYWKFAGVTNKKCVAITKVSYDHFKDFLKSYEDYRKKADAFSFDCNSNYLVISLFWLFLLLF